MYDDHHPDQLPGLVRALWFILCGWWLGLAWIGLIIICCFGILTWFLIPGLARSLPTVLTLKRLPPTHAGLKHWERQQEEHRLRQAHARSRRR